MIFPTMARSRAKRRSHSRYVSTATFGPPGRSSSSVNTRPISGDMPFKKKMLAVAITIGTCSGFVPRSSSSVSAAPECRSAKNPSKGPRKLAISKYSAGEKRAVCTPFCVNFCVISVLRLPCSVGAKWIYAPSRMLYRTVVTPMPKASVRMAPAVNPGIRRSCRTA